MALCMPVALIAVVSLNLFLKDIAELSKFEAEDTRILSRRILDATSVREENSIAGHYTPLAPSWKPGFDFISSFHDSEYMRERRYAVVSSYLYDRYFQEAGKYPDEVLFYTQLFSRPLILDVKPESMPDVFSSFIEFKNLAGISYYREYYKAHHLTLSSGPEIRVYQLDTARTGGHS